MDFNSSIQIAHFLSAGTGLRQRTFLPYVEQRRRSIMMTNVHLPTFQRKGEHYEISLCPQRNSKLCFLCFVVYQQSRRSRVDPYHCSTREPLCPSHASRSSRAISVSHNPAILVLFPMITSANNLEKDIHVSRCLRNRDLRHDRDPTGHSPCPNQAGLVKR
jgi:hypothetical protein